MIGRAIGLAIILVFWTLLCLFLVVALVVGMSLGGCSPGMPCHTNDPVGLVVVIGIVVWLAVGFVVIRVWERDVQ